tara:strand:- start:1 stop:159 length:159 start_codon:yes stop_codon:yes gene_type:complete
LINKNVCVDSVIFFYIFAQNLSEERLKGRVAPSFIIKNDFKRESNKFGQRKN